MTTDAAGVADARAALGAATGRLRQMLALVRDPEARAGGLDWTIAETTAHVLSDFEKYCSFVTGERDATAFVAAHADATTPQQRNSIGNAAYLDEHGDRDIPWLTTQLGKAVERFLDVSAPMAPDETRMTETGLAMTSSMLTATLLGEVLVHGFDIAKGARVSWTIPPGEALHVVTGVVTMLPAYLDPRAAAGLDVAYELRFRGGPRYRIAIADGALEVAAPGGRVDCWISADPVAFLLVGYGRFGQWGQALRGRIFAGGRKPWLGLRFGGLLTGV